MRYFEMNGIVWAVADVGNDSSLLIDRTGRRTVAVTDPYVHTIFMSSALSGDYRRKVLTHELCHCALVSYGLIDDIRSVVEPSNWVYAEEWICNLMADYGLIIFSNLEELL